MPFQDYRQFIELCEKINHEDKAKLFEFYLHNLALIELNVWNPNAKLGDLQLMAHAPCMIYEDVRAENVKRIIKKEETKPLYNRIEYINSMYVISNHIIISNDAQLAPRFFPTQEHVISHF